MLRLLHPQGICHESQSRRGYRIRINVRTLHPISVLNYFDSVLTTDSHLKYLIYIIFSPDCPATRCLRNNAIWSARKAILTSYLLADG